MDRARDLGELEGHLGVAFRDKELLRLALVHSSYFYENPGAFAETNERLEFLGDAVIGVAVAEQLFRRNPGWSEGELTHVRSTLVSGETLAEVARGLDLGRELYMGKGAETVGTRDRRSCLASTLEAVVGALFMDQGYGAARDLVNEIIPFEGGMAAREATLQNAKSELQERLQARGEAPPTYRSRRSGGPEHEPVFAASVEIGGTVLGRGKGSSKSNAEREAAAQALEALDGR